MLRLPGFRVATPTTIAEAVAALAEPGARPIAGGTDLLPNLKHRLGAPTVLVQLGRLPLREIAVRDGALCIGAGAVLADLAAHPLVVAHAPSLARAAGLVAGPTLRNLGTLGGNLHLDTRCRYVNQTPLWREALGGCLKSHGDRCHVVPGGQTCVAALSSDCAPVLVALDATLTLHGPDGARTVALADYYRADGTERRHRQAPRTTQRDRALERDDRAERAEHQERPVVDQVARPPPDQHAQARQPGEHAGDQRRRDDQQHAASCQQPARLGRCYALHPSSSLAAADMRAGDQGGSHTSSTWTAPMPAIACKRVVASSRICSPSGHAAVVIVSCTVTSAPSNSTP